MAVASSFDVTKILDYALQNVDKIMGLFVGGLKAIEQITVYEDIREETGLTTLKAGNLGAPYKDDFEPKANAMSFGYRKLKPEMGKVDLQIVPLHFYKTWLVTLRKAGVDAYQLPYEQFFFDQIALKLADEVNRQSVFSGVKAVGTTTKDIADGFGKIIADEIVSGDITNVVATGAVTAANAVDKFELMADALPSHLRDVPMSMYVSHTMADKYRKDYRDKFGKYVGDNDKMVLDGKDNISLEKCSWIPSTSSRILLTPKDNLIMGTDSISDLNKIEIVKDIRLLKIGMQFTLCYNYADAEPLYVNDQA